MKKIFFKWLLFCLTFLVINAVSFADIVIPKTLNVQGRVTSDSGQPITGKKCTIKLKIGLKEFTVDNVQLDNEGLYSTNVAIDDFLKDATFEELYKFKVSVQPEGEYAIESSENDFSAVPYSFYSSTASYLDVRGSKLVNGNFDSTSIYKINVDTATYAIKASSISSNGISGYVWGIDGAGNQNWVSAGSLSISTATQSTIGGIMLGDDSKDTGLSSSIPDGILKVKPATASKIGGVKIGNNINVDGNGVISISTATNSVLGLVKVSAVNGLSITDGEISVSKADKSKYGTVKIGDNINVADGVISVNPSSLVIPLATKSSTGTVKVGSNINININNGEISVNTADATNAGVMKLYTATGSNADGTITQTAITTAIGGKQDKIDGTHKLSADLVQDGDTNKVFTSTLKTIYDGYGTAISGKEDTTNKTDSYTETSATKYPSSKALSDGLATKQNTISGTNKISATFVDGLATVATSGKTSDLTNDSNFITKDVNDLTNYTTTTNMNTELGKKQNTIDSSNKISATFVDGLATVATSGSYNDLTDKPTVPTKTSDLTNDSNFVVDESYVHTDNNFTTLLKTAYDGYEARIYALEHPSSGADLAEIYKSTENLVPGDVVSIDTTKDNSIVRTRVAEDTLVAGVISTEPGLLLNKNEKGYKLALVGKVPTKVCNEGGNIKRGDLLVSSSIAGHAKKAGDNPKAGTVIGKALENFDSQKGTILVLVNLQ